MLQSDFGTLHLPLRPQEPVPVLSWSDYDENRILLVLATVTFLIILPTIYNIFPALRGCMARSRGNLEVEHSLSTARARNICARTLFLPLLAIASRYPIYDAAFIPPVEEALMRLVRLTETAVAYLFLRDLIHALVFHFGFPRMETETRKAIRKCIFNYYILLVLTATASVIGLYVLQAEDLAVCRTIWVEIAVFMGIALVRKSQILRQSCSVLGTFLYLCGLEIIPAAAIVLAGLLL